MARNTKTMMEPTTILIMQVATFFKTTIPITRAANAKA